MPDIEAVAEPSPCSPPTLPDPPPVDLWVMLRWHDVSDLGSGGFWILAGGSWNNRDDAMRYTINDPRRERIVHIVEPKGYSAKVVEPCRGHDFRAST